MSYPLYFNPKNSLNLYELSDKFDFLKNLYIKDKLPKVLMLSGKKGSGKGTLINHLLFFIYDKENYDEKNYKILKKSSFYNQFLNNIYSNIIYLSGSNYKNISIEDIRNLKKKIFQTSIVNQSRFIIFDDIELFNINSLNALLKIIEEPGKKNYFILINNNSKPLLDTIKSRCLEIKVILNDTQRIKIIESIAKSFNLNLIIDPKYSNLAPGNFIKFNYICEENNILINEDFLKNLTTLLNLYKKNKDVMFIEMILFLTNYYFSNLKPNNNISREKTIESKRFVFENINKFFLYNLNQNALLNAISSKINNE
jgi:DNA polymerase-3 subunit delta'